MKLTTCLPPVALVLTLAACQSSPPPAVGDRMFDHFHRAGQVQTSLIVGDLEGARRPASWLASYEELDVVLADQERWLEQLRGTAGEIAAAASMAEAAAATGRLGATCAGCHRNVGDGPRFQQMTSAPSADGTVSHMKRHLWAMDRMWEGLISGSTQTWVSGASAIATVEPEEIAGGPVVAALAEEVHRQADEARSVTRVDRPAAYAGLLETCAACHTTLGIGTG